MRMIFSIGWHIAKKGVGVTLIRDKKNARRLLIGVAFLMGTPYVDVFI